MRDPAIKAQQVLALLVLSAWSIPSVAQEDSLAVFEHEAIVVTGKRYADPVRAATSAMSVIRLSGFSRMPVENTADLLQTMPGLSFVDKDGLGADPVAAVRGFYGGGEAEYLLVAVDGVPVNYVETGLVSWETLIGQDAESIEFSRGGASSLYGDVAMGGVVNVRTADRGSSVRRARLSAGSYGAVEAGGALRSTVGVRRLGISGGLKRTDGFRDHGKRETANLEGSADILQGESTELRARVESRWRDVEDPGYLPEQLVESDPSQSLPFFAFDGIDERVHRAAVDGSWKPGGGYHLTVVGGGDYRDGEVVRTVLLTPDFADTKRREIETHRLFANVQLRGGFVAGTTVGRWQVGLDASTASLDSRYYDLVRGGRDDYLTGVTTPEPTLDESGETSRKALAGYAQAEILPIEPVTLSIGVRADRISDSFAPEKSDLLGPSDATHSEISPKAGVNVAYSSGPLPGNFYASVSRSFKAPALDQLYDQRSIPVPFEPYKISLSNTELKPQFGTQYEAGIYQTVPFASGAATAEVSLAVYRIDLEDELDFSIEQFRYVNIGESRHDGLELGLKMAARGFDGFVSYALQNATTEVGEFQGNRLKAIPLHSYSVGIMSPSYRGFGGGLKLSGASDTFLDDANEMKLDNYRRMDARLSYGHGVVSVTIDVFNLFDASYSTNGFPDASGFPVVYLYPAAGRRAKVGMSLTL